MINNMDMGNVLDCFSQTIKLKTITKTSVDFVESEVVTESNISAVVQPTKMEDLQADNIDWSLTYYTIHTRSLLQVNDFIEYRNKDYKVISVAKWNDYGYYECITEETKRVVK